MDECFCCDLWRHFVNVNVVNDLFLFNVWCLHCFKEGNESLDVFSRRRGVVVDDDDDDDDDGQHRFGLLFVTHYMLWVNAMIGCMP